MRFAYTATQGTVSIVTAAPKESLERVLGPLTDEQYRAHIIERSIPADAIDVQELPADWTPPDDRTFRNAWRKSGANVVVDMPAARAIHMERIRAERNKKLAALDVETMRALGAGDNARRAQIEAQKQRLRDLPQTFDLSAASTPDELKALWPAELT